LKLQHLDDLAQTREQLGWAERMAAPPLRPTVVEALKALGDVARR